MKRVSTVAAILILTAAAVCGCSRSSQDRQCAEIAASNSYLECAAGDLMPDGTRVLRLAEPGMCPGHFDVRFSQINDLRRCRVLLRLDFQKSLDARLGPAVESGLQVAEVSLPGGLCVPESYLAACGQTAEALVAAGLLDRPAAESRLNEIDHRIRRTVARCRRQAEPLAGTPVIASTHQEGFCRWLGLRPVATFTAADSASVGRIDEAVRAGQQAGVKLVVANLPEGRQLADAIAERLGAKVVVFGNFPSVTGGLPSFDSLIISNVESLLEAVSQ